MARDDAARLTTGSDTEALAALSAAYSRIRSELGRVIIGQESVVEQLLTVVLSRGHGILVGVPGLAKTLLVSSLADCLDVSFKRIQFTPDLMPADITGTEIIQEDQVTRERVFVFMKGPLFAHIILADEINRTPPKTQAALLEAMQERRVTSGGAPYPLPDPFFVLATQNPIEQEGTYPLPEAQLDRFMFMIRVGYPSAEEEKAIVAATTGAGFARVTSQMSGPDLIRAQDLVRKVPAGDHVIQYALNLSRATRPDQPEAPDFVREYVSWGAGPRASQHLVLGAKARAALHGAACATTDDVAAIAHPVLRHRVIVNFNAEAEGISPDTIVDRLLERTPRLPAS